MKRQISDINLDFFQGHPILNKHVVLLDHIRQKFQKKNDVWFIKVPGRVNLIGEHVDYNNGVVLPCAIDREIVICLTGNSSGLVRISNVNPDYPEIEFSVRKTIVPDEKGFWGNYIKAGVNGIVEYLSQSTDSNLLAINGFDAVISSTLPPAAGLSSSSTLVVGAALAILLANEIQVDKLTIAEICAKAEHFVGTSGGGMDHAACLLGKKDSFLKIEFNPLIAEPIPAPGDVEIILFHSLVEAEKSSHVREEYNRRVLECGFALDLFNRFISNHLQTDIKPLKNLGDISPPYFNISELELDVMISEYLKSLPESHSLKELVSIFEVSQHELAIQYRNVLRGAELNELPGGYKVKGRFKHVYTECQRVQKAITCLLNNDKVQLGKLLDKSHDSLAKDYEVSTPEVDSIVKLLKKFGAFGARLVGAGFGGMILALSDHTRAEGLIENMQNSFYSKIQQQKFTDYIVRCNTADGAGLI